MDTKKVSYNVIISIKPRYAEMIIDGRKKFEFRKCSFNKPVYKVFIYAIKPMGKLIGYFTFSEILMGKPSKIWDLCSELAGISESSFIEYYEGKSTAYAIKIEKVFRFENPINPFDLIEGFKAPRSFIYFKYEIIDRTIISLE
jgi:predicted transcriptional regulator